MQWLTPSLALPPFVQSHFLPLLAGKRASDQCVWDSLDTSSICVCELVSQQAFFTIVLSGSLFAVAPLQTFSLRLSKHRWNFDEIVLHLAWHDVNMLWSKKCIKTTTWIYVPYKCNAMNFTWEWRQSCHLWILSYTLFYLGSLQYACEMFWCSDLNRLVHVSKEEYRVDLSQNKVIYIHSKHLS